MIKKVANVLAVVGFIVSGASSVFALGDSESEDEAMAALDAYIGDWQSVELKTSQDGRDYHFGYILKYTSPAKTAARLTIEFRYTDGQRSPIWEGFKSRNLLGGGTYYVAFDVFGRMAIGDFGPEGDLFVTRYEGTGPGGSVLQIRDEFTRPQDGQFASMTQILGDGEWREVLRDTWRQTESPKK